MCATMVINPASAFRQFKYAIRAPNGQLPRGMERKLSLRLKSHVLYGFRDRNDILRLRKVFRSSKESAWTELHLIY